MKKVSKNIIFNYFCIAFLSGIFINNIFKDLYIFIYVLIFLLVLFFVYFFFKKRFFYLFLFIIIGLLFGALISFNNLENIKNKEILLEKYFSNKTHNILLEIKNTNKIGEFKNEYIVKLLKIDEKKIEKNILGKIILPSNYNPKKGYIIKLDEKLIKIENFDSGFDYKNYMLSKNIYFNVKANFYKLEEPKEINIIEKNIIKLRGLFLKAIKQLYPEEEAIFLGGILIGARESLSSELKTNFNNSGLTHFIAVSGFNITILILFVSFILQYFPIFIRVIFITSFIAFFTVLVGDTAPVIRASIMGLIGYYILVSGRSGSSLSIILLTALIMIIISPFSLNYDVSLHLSFLAVLGIIYSQNFFEKVFKFLPNFLEIRTAFVLTLSALVFTLPIMIFNFGQVSLLAPIANIAVTWTIPIAMLLGFLSILVYFVFPFLAYIIGYFTWIFLKWDMLVVNFFGNLDWSLLKMDFGFFKNYIEIIYFIIMIFLIIYFRKK